MKDEISAARCLLEAREANTPHSLKDWQPRAPLDVAAGYAMQDEGSRLLIKEKGWSQIGWKIGGTNQVARDMLSVEEPFYGRLYGRCWDDSGFTFRASPLHLVWEPEIAVELARDLNPADAPFDAATIEAATASLRPALEIVATCLTPWLEAGGPSLIADNAVHGHWVTGAPVTEWSDIDLLDDRVTLRINGIAAAEGTGRAVDGGCFGAVAWLANRLAINGVCLSAGQFISSGTIVTPPPIASGQAVEADFGRLGRVSSHTLP